MKAVTLGSDRRLALVNVPAPVAGAGEVLVAVEACGICGTDLHAADIAMFVPPVIIGHEFSGSVAAVGDGVEDLVVGDRVAVNPMADVCGQCEHCAAGAFNYCQSAIYERAVGVSRDGGMAEFVSVPASLAHRLPDAVDAVEGAWVEPVAVAVRAVRRSPVQAGDRVMVLGGGPIGLLVVQMLRTVGVTDITVVEPSALRRQVATALGAASIEPGTAVASSFDGAFECSGHPTAFRSAVDGVRHGGWVQLVGASASPVSFDSIPLLHKELRISTSFIYVDEFAEAIELLASDAIDVRPLTSRLVPIDRFEEAFEAMRSGDGALKALVTVGIESRST